MTRVPCEVVIVGAGPQALTVACYLITADPTLQSRIRIVDPGEWMQQWNRQFQRLRIPFLRSSCVHHPDPDPYALLKFARHNGRSTEFQDSIARPSTKLFGDFCTHLIRTYGLAEQLMHDRVNQISPLETGVTVTTVSGRRYQARHVVIATNPMHTRCHSRIQGIHSHYIDLRAFASFAGRTIAVVGGGLTAAQLALTAWTRGGQVHLISRRPLKQRDLDVGPEWLGRALPAFHRTMDAHHRARIVSTARDGGSVPPRTLRELMAAATATDRPPLELREGQVHAASRTASGFRITTDGGELLATDVWLATGYTVRLENEPLLLDLHRRCPVAMADGLPVLSNSLSWSSTGIHLCGGLAALSVGPTARTLPGARIAAERICAAITGRMPARAAQYPVPPQQSL